MALIVETGSGASNSEAYISVVDCDAYLEARGMTTWATMSADEKEHAIRRAADFMGQAYRARWKGSRVNLTQALDWPRSDVPRSDGLTAYYDSTVIPAEVVRANAELAFRAAAGELAPDLGQTVASESVGSISVTYAAGSMATKRYPAMEALLRPLLALGSSSVKLIRG